MIMITTTTNIVITTTIITITIMVIHIATITTPLRDAKRHHPTAFNKSARETSGNDYYSVWQFLRSRLSLGAERRPCD